MADDDHLRQHQATVYNRARRRLSLADTAAGLVGLAAIAIWADRLGGWGCVAALAVGLPLISIPFGYAGHVLSRRNGLSRQTVAGWLADQAKARLIGLALGGAVALGLLGCQRLSPDWWALPAWAGAVTLSVALTILWPVLLLPLFVRSEPVAEGELAEELWRTIRASGVAVKELRLLHMGEKTSAANAMVAGLGPTLRVYVGDTIAEGSEAETGIEDTRLVLAHELGHHVTNDVWRLLAWSALALAAGMAGAWASVRWLAPDGPGHLTCLPALMIGFMLASSAISPLGAAYSRRRERAADAYAVSVTGQGERYAETFERLVEQNLMELRPPYLWHALTASHPMPADRIAAARARG